MNKKVTKLVIIFAGILAVVGCVSMFILSPIGQKTGNIEIPDADGSTAEILSGITVEQKFQNITENITEIAVVFDRAYYLYDEANMIIELADGNNVLAKDTYSADNIPGSHRTYLKPNAPINGYVGKELTIRIYTDSTAGTGLSLMTTNKGGSYKFGDQKVNGSICFSVIGE